MFIGTFNPAIPGNHADFFYGRNFFWQVMALLNDPQTKFRNKAPRIATNQKSWPPKNDLQPSLAEILDLTTSFKMVFADLIGSVFSTNQNIEHVKKGQVRWNGETFDLIEDAALAKLAKKGQVNWNTGYIIDYLTNNPQIKHIYFTRQMKDCWLEQLQILENDQRLKGRKVIRICPPASGAKVPSGSEKRQYIMKAWLAGGNGYGRLDHDWLTKHGVNPDHFLH